MSEEKVRLGGMALPNGVLVHGPTSWACAVRTDKGELRVASGRKRLRSAEAKGRLAQALLRLAEVFALFPAVRRALPEAELPFGRPKVAAAMVGSAVAARALRRSAL